MTARSIASASGDGKVRLWDPDPPRGKSALKRTIEIGPPGGLVKQVHWTPDGRHLDMLNGNGTIYVLGLEENAVRPSIAEDNAGHDNNEKIPEQKQRVERSREVSKH